MPSTWTRISFERWWYAVLIVEMEVFVNFDHISLLKKCKMLSNDSAQTFLCNQDFLDRLQVLSLEFVLPLSYQLASENEETIIVYPFSEIFFFIYMF